MGEVRFERRRREGCMRGDLAGLGEGVKVLWRLDRMDLDLVSYRRTRVEKGYSTICRKSGITLQWSILLYFYNCGMSSLLCNSHILLFYSNLIVYPMPSASHSSRRIGEGNSEA